MKIQFFLNNIFSALIDNPNNFKINRLIRIVVSGMFLFHALLRLCVSLHFRLISWKPSLKWTPSKAISCLGPLGVRFRQFSLQSTLIIQFQQASNCSKLTVNTRKRCEICSNLTIKTY